MTVICRVSFFLATETFALMNFSTLVRRGTSVVPAPGLPALARHAALLLLVAGVGVWAAVLLAPMPAGVPPGLTAPPPPRGDTAAVARWFGATQASIKVSVAGLISSGDRGAALLRIDNGPVQAWRVGQALTAGVTLTSVERDAVVLDVGGITQRVQAPMERPLTSPGLVRVAP